MQNSNRIGLASFFSSTQLVEFRDDHWPHFPFVVHGLSESIRELTSLPFLRSLDDLLNSWPRSVQAHLPDLADEASSVDATPSDARKLFTNRMGLLFNNVEVVSPILKMWIEQIRSDLGMPTMTYGRCLVYATPDGKGTAAHFDQNMNFVLQLQGTKKWRLAPNPSVPNPTQRHTMGQLLDVELATYIDGKLPTEFPLDAQDIILQPGSLLFVPRGYWHSTEAAGEALALNFTYNQPTWIDLLTTALRSRLSLSPEWRELADGVTSQNPDDRELAKFKFDQLLMELTGDLPNWRAEDILTATEK